MVDTNWYEVKGEQCVAFKLAFECHQHHRVLCSFRHSLTHLIVRVSIRSLDELDDIRPCGLVHLLRMLSDHTDVCHWINLTITHTTMLLLNCCLTLWISLEPICHRELTSVWLIVDTLQTVEYNIFISVSGCHDDIDVARLSRSLFLIQIVQCDGTIRRIVHDHLTHQCECCELADRFDLVVDQVQSRHVRRCIGQ